MSERSGAGDNATSTRPFDFATVQLTFLSIVVALILENALGSLSDNPLLWAWTEGSLILWLQIVILSSATIASWAGFAISISFGRPAGASDFVYPVLLLVCLYAAGTTLYPASEPHMYLLASAAASTVAGLMLVNDVRFVRERGFDGPTSAAWSQAALAVLFLAGALAWRLAGISTIPFLVVGALVEMIGLASALNAWRGSSIGADRAPSILSDRPPDASESAREPTQPKPE